MVFSQDLEGKIIVDELKQEVISTSSKAEPPQCTSLAWSADGQVRTSGIRVIMNEMRYYWKIIFIWGKMTQNYQPLKREEAESLNMGIYAQHAIDTFFV